MSDRRRGLLYVFIAALLWSSGGLAIKLVEATPIAIAGLRSGIAAVVLFAWFRPRVKRWSPSFIVAVVSYAACLTTFVLATRWTTAANAIFLQYAGVFWVMLLSPLILKEPRRREDVIAIIAAFAGMALFFVGDFEPRGLAGNFAAVVSSIFFALLIIGLRLERDASPEAAISWGNLLAIAALTPFLWNDLDIDARSWAILGWLGVVQIALAYAFFVAGIKRVTATEASLTGMIEPIANPVWVFLILGERPKLIAMVGSAIVLGAVAWRTFTDHPVAEILPPD